MRWLIAAVMFCVLTGWTDSGRADGCDCRPTPVRHRHVAHVVHRHVRVAGCPIALAHEIRTGCGWYYYQISPTN